MSNDFEQEQLLFNLCVDEPAERWPAILEQHTADPALRDRVLKLLQHHSDTAARESGFLRLDPADPERIGPYRILQRLGEGGMGIVYAAEQREPVRRRVAIKVLRSGHSREVLARFDAERQALSLMNHPGIARILDAGTTADQRPYIVMEYVSGEPITRYCRHRELALEVKLELFRQVCDAVQHAHQKGIIHRDLKPSNILVTEELGKPAPKVIDFGIAKAMTLRLTDHTLETKVGSFLGTPDYMSPEQADISPIDVDTRADVYALGAILYELLTGTTPFQVSKEQHSWTEIQRILREQEAAPPSRRTSQRLPRELDWITCKALEKDRNRRYATAAAFAEDILAVLEGNPPHASPHTFGYRAGKLIRRHALGAATAAGMFVLVLAFGGAMAWQASQIAKERDRANEEASVAREVLLFMAGVFELANPAVSGTDSISAQEMLDLGLRRIDSQEDEHPPRVRGALLHAAGDAYRGIGDYQRADALLQDALKTYSALDLTGSEVARVLVSLSRLRRSQGDFEGAIVKAQEAIRIAEFLAEPGDTPVDAKFALAQALLDNSRQDEGAEIAEGILSASKAGTDIHAKAALILGRARHDQGRLTEAKRILLDAVDMHMRLYGPAHGRTIEAKAALGSTLTTLNESEAAIAIMRDVVDATAVVYGTKHFAVGSALNDLANALSNDSRYIEEAEAAYRDALAIYAQVLREDHPEIATTLNNLGTLYLLEQEWRAAADAFEASLRIRRSALGEAHSYTASSKGGLALALNKLGEFDRAEDLLREVIETLDDQLGDANWRAANYRHYLADVLLNRGSLQEAELLAMNARSVLEDALGHKHWRTIAATATLARIHQAQGKLEQALDGFEQAYALAVEAFGEGNQRTIEIGKRLRELRRE